MSTRNRLVDISTHWSGVHDPARFAMRYASAVRVYLTNLLPDPNDADDVAQDFFLQVSRQGFVKANPERGKFRQYLAVSVRNAARKHLRKRTHSSTFFADDLQVYTADLPLCEWRKCLIDRVMRILHHHERTTPGNLFHTVLTIRGEYPEDASTSQAEHAGRRSGRPITPAAYRKQVSRALRAFAWLLACEVADTVEPRQATTVEAELRETGLFDLVADHLPEDWRTRGFERSKQ